MIWGANFTQASRGWICDMHFAVQTKRQFTSERHEVRGGGRNVLAAYLRAYHHTIKECRRLQSLPGDFEIYKGRWVRFSYRIRRFWSGLSEKGLH